MIGKYIVSNSCVNGFIERHCDSLAKHNELITLSSLSNDDSDRGGGS